ncbi:MAG: MlaD family protein [Pseudomonadota bacterium]|nr:MlaD family protein [Pseudomonadota bacterium]
MTEQGTRSPAPPEELLEATVVPRSRVSMVWLIPVVALLIGGWLAYKTFSEQGPRISIQFKTAAGLQAGKTKVKFKDVEVGTVTAIHVSADLKTVTVAAELVDGAEVYLTEKTRFWVARPRVTASRVSGLETLLSGAYIAIDPVTEGQQVRDFVGLEEPPLFTTSEPGKKFVLRSESLGSLNVGSPVHYRNIQVGQVVDYKLDKDGRAVSIHLFIAAPNDHLVLTNTRFWNASGFDFTLSVEGVQVDTQSLLSVLIGGVAFDTPDSLEQRGVIAEENQFFPLYASREKAHEKIYLDRERYLMFFEGSVRGLSLGAPVLLRGIKLGEVLDVQLKFNVDEFRFHIPVLIEIEPDRIGIIGDRSELKQHDVLERLVEQGLRGQLKSGSLLTGQLYVDLDLHPEAPKASIKESGDYRVIPTVAAPLEAMTTKATKFLDRLQKLPLEEIGNDLRDTMKGAKAIANSEALKRSITELDLALKQVRETARAFDKDVTPELNAALGQARQTLKAAEGVVAPNSVLYTELRGLLRELSAAARSIRVMADYLERHPEALIKGKGTQR